jgi:hypothetical protein
MGDKRAETISQNTGGPKRNRHEEYSTQKSTTVAAKHKKDHPCLKKCVHLITLDEQKIIF